MARDKVFISYSHDDREWMERLERMLQPLVRNGSIDLWSDTEIRPGARWRQEIEQALAAARVAVLLVSDNFLASEFIAKQELPPLLRAAEQEGVTILWIYVSPCLYEATSIGDYQAAHDLRASLLELEPAQQQVTLREVCQRIRQAAAVPLSEPIPLERLSERHEVLVLPERGDDVASVLSLHLGRSTVIGRCYAAQLREAAREALAGLDEERVHWVLAWDDDGLNQVMARLDWSQDYRERTMRVENLTAYSRRRQSFALLLEGESEREIRAGEVVSCVPRAGGRATLTTGAGSGRRQLVSLAIAEERVGRDRLPWIQAETSFLFPPAGGDSATTVRFSGGWIPIDAPELSERLGDQGALTLQFRGGPALEIRAWAGQLRVTCETLDLQQLLSSA